jgi:hypothetical protein
MRHRLSSFADFPVAHRKKIWSTNRPRREPWIVPLIEAVPVVGNRRSSPFVRVSNDLKPKVVLSPYIAGRCTTTEISLETALAAHRDAQDGHHQHPAIPQLQ